MIPRYSRPEMTEIWTDESRFQIWFEMSALNISKNTNNIFF